MCGTKIKIDTVEGDFNAIDSPETKVDSIINIIIGDIVSTAVKIDFLDRKFPASITIKIEHNNLRSKRIIVQQYKSYSSNVEKAYAIADRQIINGKQTAMVLLNGMYVNSLDKFGIDPFDIDLEGIRMHADSIVDDVIKQLRKFVYKSSNTPSFKEQVEIGINVVVAHAFVECLVLENPNATN